MDTLSIPIGNSTDTSITRSLKRLVALLGTLITAPAIVVFAMRIREGMTLFAVPDEAEQFVAARMIYHGRHLYGDVFSHHGPFMYLVAHLYASWIDESDFSYIRLSQAFLAGVSCAALVLSPAIETKLARVWVAGIYTLLLSCFWTVEGLNAFLYYTLSGFLLVPLVAQYVVPLALDREPGRFWLFVSGVTAAFACFCTYSNGVALAFLILSPLPHLLSQPHRGRLLRYTKPLGLGMVSAALVVGIWMLRYGDLKGYFVYHFYFNEQVYKQYISFTLADSLQNFSFSFEPEAIVHSFSLSLLACAIYILALLQKRGDSTTKVILSAVLLALVVGGVVFTNPRAMPAVGDGGFVTMSLALFGLASACLLDRYLIHRVTLGLVNAMLLCGAVLFLASRVEGNAKSFLGVPERELSSDTDAMKPGRDAIYSFVRAVTKEDGDLLALNYDATVYFKADRIPASGNLFYLPWQATYNRQPKVGYKIDICADIRNHRPAVIWFFNWRVWEQYSLDDYEPCILALISEGYTPLRFDSPWHIRNDLYRNTVAKLPADADTSLNLVPPIPKVLSLSARLTRFVPIEMVMSPTHLERGAVLRRIGILIGTYGRQNNGEAELHLQGPGGAEVFRRFLLSELEDNKYHFFDVDPGRYTSAEIRSITGEGVSAWESHLVDSAIYTCVIYEYVDRVRRYTPACPVVP